MKTIDMTGQVVGSLTVLYAVEAKKGRAFWMCRCVCGVEKAVSGKHLRSGQVVSCGCQRGAKPIYADYSVRRKELAVLNVESRREAQRRYREKNKEVVALRNRESQARYREAARGTPILEAVSDADKFWAKVSIAGGDDCWIWSGATNESGYGLYAPMPGMLVGAHRVSYALVNGEITDDLFVCHHCDTPGCVNPSHLFLGTAADNNSDKAAKGRSNAPKGERNGQAKLTPDQVIAIFTDPRTNSEIAAQYGVEKSLVSMIRRRKVWAHTTAHLPEQPVRKTGPKRLSNATLQALTR